MNHAIGNSPSIAFHEALLTQHPGLQWRSEVDNPRFVSQVALLSFLLLLLASLAGCSSEPKQLDDPLAVMQDPMTVSQNRLEAMQQAALVERDNPERIKALKEIMTGKGGHPLKVRLAAFDQLYAHNPASAKVTLYYRLPFIPSNDLVAVMCKRIADEGWTEFTPSLVRSLSTGESFEDPNERPDGKALMRLHPGQSLNQIVLGAIENPGSGVPAKRWRQSAWNLLHQIGAPQDYLIKWIGDTTRYQQGDSFFDDLHRGYTEMGIIPETMEEMLWLHEFLTPDYAEHWSAYRAVVAAVPSSQQQSFSLRHLPILHAVYTYRPDWFTLTKNELRSILRRELVDRPHYYSGTGGGGGKNLRRPQNFEDWEDKIQWADLLAIRLGDQLIRDPDIRSDLIHQIGRDRTDTSTELGGILTISPEGRAKLVEFAPRRMANDTRYLPSDKMVIFGYISLFHYHFHVQEINNRDYAGPGLGDLGYANVMRINGIVLTSVSTNRTNVDYYQEGKVVIDLGILEE